MNSRGVVIVMYDLPVGTPEERHNAYVFRKTIIKNGYLELQKSVYVKLLRSMSNYKRERIMLKEVAPKNGVVTVLPLTLKQFKKISSITEEKFNMETFSDDVIAV